MKELSGNLYGVWNGREQVGQEDGKEWVGFWDLYNRFFFTCTAQLKVSV